MSKNIVLDVNHMMSDIIGYPYGIDASQVDALSDAAAQAQRNVQKNRGTGWLGWMELPYNQEDVVAHIERPARARTVRRFRGAGHRRQRPGPHRRAAGA